MNNDPIDDVIAALHAFEPGHDDTDNVPRLYEIFDNFGSLTQRARAMPAMFSLFERFPDADFGSPGPLVHELEAIPNYLPLLRTSLGRVPTGHTVWMMNRVLNTKLPDDHRELWLSELRAVLVHPHASEQTRKVAEMFLAHQERTVR